MYNHAKQCSYMVCVDVSVVWVEDGRRYLGRLWGGRYKWQCCSGVVAARRAAPRLRPRRQVAHLLLEHRCEYCTHLRGSVCLMHQQTQEIRVVFVA